MSITGKQVLIIDDISDIRLLLRKILENIGLQVREASSIDEAISLVEEETPHLITVDLHLPGKSGFDFLSIRKTHPKLNNIPVIVASGLNDKESISKAIGLNASDYIIKPFTTAVVTQKVRKQIRDLNFKKIKFPENNLPSVSMLVPAKITSIEETSFLIEAPLRLSGNTEIVLSSETLATFNIEGCILKTQSADGIRGVSRDYYSKVHLLGINQSVIKKMKRVKK